MHNGESMMKKRRVLMLALVIITVAGCLGGYCLIDSVFPKAPPIRLPEAKEVISVNIAENEQQSHQLSHTEFELLLNEISTAVPTRKMSVNDYPTTRPYYKISVTCRDITYYYFFYTEDNQSYIEMPYEGIYKTDAEIYNLISKKQQENPRQ